MKSNWHYVYVRVCCDSVRVLILDLVPLGVGGVGVGGTYLGAG